MIQITPQMRVLVAVEAVDFRRGIDGLAKLCRETLQSDPFSGAVKLLVDDGQGFWLCHKRLSHGKFRWWPSGSEGAGACMRPHELQVLLCGGDPSATRAAPVWREVGRTM